MSLSTQAIGAFDVALYDLKARRAGLPGLDEEPPDTYDHKGHAALAATRMGAAVPTSRRAQSMESQ